MDKTAIVLLLTVIVLGLVLFFKVFIYFRTILCIAELRCMIEDGEETLHLISKCLIDLETSKVLFTSTLYLFHCKVLTDNLLERESILRDHLFKARNQLVILEMAKKGGIL